MSWTVSQVLPSNINVPSWDYCCSIFYWFYTFYAVHTYYLDVIHICVYSLHLLYLNIFEYDSSRQSGPQDTWPGLFHYSSSTACGSPSPLHYWWSTQTHKLTPTHTPALSAGAPSPHHRSAFTHTDPLTDLLPLLPDNSVKSGVYVLISPRT